MASSHHNPNSPSANHCLWCIMCRVWWKLFAWVPVLLIVAVVTWSYYAYVIQLCFGMVTSMTQSVCYLIFFHIFLVMFIWSYWQTIFTWPQPVPSKFRLAESDMEALLAAANEEGQRAVLEYFAKNLPVVTRTMSGSIRYCNRCILVKPDRAHHCSMCGRCVLKMDHHCPWVNNCVNFHNYKFFILFLGYSLLYCIFITTSVLPYFISFWKAPDPAQGLGRFHVVFVFFVALMFAISLGSLFGYHLYLIIHNRSTLESFRAPMFRGGPDKNGFSLGYYKNFVQVFGENKLLWPLPVFTSVGSGSEFPVRREHQLQNYVVLEQRSYDAMGSVRSSVGDGVTYPEQYEDEDTESLLSGERRWGQTSTRFEDHMESSSSFDEV